MFDVTSNNRRRGENRWLAEKTTGGAFGAIESIDIKYLRTKRQPVRPWLTQKALSGGGVRADLGSLMIIIAPGMLPARLGFRAQCHPRRYGSTVSDVADLVTAVVAIDRTAGISLKVDRGMSLPTSAQAIITYGRGGPARNRDSEGPKSDGYGHIFEDFLGAIAAGPRPDLAPVDDTMHLLAALYLSAAGDGERVDGAFRRER